MDVLFINAVDGNFEKSFLSVEFVFSIVFRESDGYIYAVARVMTDELFFKVIDVSVGADHKISAVSLCVSTFKFHAVNGADIVDIDGITVLNGEATAGLGDVEYFASPESDEAGISALSEEDEEATAFAETQDYTAKNFIHQLDVQTEGSLTITGKVCKGVVSGHAASDDTPIYVKIFDGDWNEVASF